MSDIKKKLSKLTVSELKDLLRHNNLSTSGNKNVLIDRVVENLDVEFEDEPKYEKYLGDDNVVKLGKGKTIEPEPYLRKIIESYKSNMKETDEYEIFTFKVDLSYSNHFSVGKLTLKVRTSRGDNYALFYDIVNEFFTTELDDYVLAQMYLLGNEDIRKKLGLTKVDFEWSVGT